MGMSLLLTAAGWQDKSLYVEKLNSMDPVLNQIGFLGIIPIVTIEDEKKSIPCARTLQENGLPIIEITFRTQAAAYVIKQIASDSSEMLIGAGTILTKEDAQTAIDAGARFIVSPGFNPKVVKYCIDKSITVLPGVFTPTEIQYAVEFGLEAIKFFPAEAGGGLKYLKAVAAPFKSLKFIPTGGIDQSTLLSYLRFSKVLACGGSWMVQPEMIRAGQFEQIAELICKAVACVKER